MINPFDTAERVAFRNTLKEFVSKGHLLLISGMKKEKYLGNYIRKLAL